MQKFITKLIFVLLFFIISCDPNEKSNNTNNTLPKKEKLQNSFKKYLNSIKVKKITSINTPYWNKVRKRKLVISFTPDSPPFCVKKNGKIEGFNHALAKIICKTLGIEPELKILPLKDQLKSLLDGQVDIILAPMTRTAERATQIAFSKPYYHVTQGVLLRRGNLFISKYNSASKKYVGKKVNNFFDLDCFKKLTIAVKAGSSNEMLCQMMFSKKDFKVKTYSTNDKAVKALLNAKADAMVADHTYVKVWSEINSQHFAAVAAITGKSTQDGLGIAIRKGDLDFLNWLNVLIDEIKGNSILDTLKIQYIQNLSWLK